MWDKIKLAFHERDWRMVVFGLAMMVFGGYLKYFFSGIGAVHLGLAIFFGFLPLYEDIAFIPNVLMWYAFVLPGIAILVVVLLILAELIGQISQKVNRRISSVQDSVLLYERPEKPKKKKRDKIEVLEEEPYSTLEDAFRQRR